MGCASSSEADLDPSMIQSIQLPGAFKCDPRLHAAADFTQPHSDCNLFDDAETVCSYGVKTDEPTEFALFCRHQRLVISGRLNGIDSDPNQFTPLPEPRKDIEKSRRQCAAWLPGISLVIETVDEMEQQAVLLLPLPRFSSVGGRRNTLGEHDSARSQNDDSIGTHPGMDIDFSVTALMTPHSPTPFDASSPTVSPQVQHHNSDLRYKVSTTDAQWLDGGSSPASVDLSVSDVPAGTFIPLTCHTLALHQRVLQKDSMP